MSQTDLRRYLDDRAATVDLPPDLADAVRSRATTRRRNRAMGVAAVLAAVLALGAALGPTLQRSTRADVVDSPPDGRAVVPRTIPPLGNDLPSLDEHPMIRVTVAWSGWDPTALATGGDTERLVGLDAEDGQPVILAHGVSRGAPVVVSPDGRSIAYVAEECGRSDRGSLDVMVPSLGGSGGFGNCNVVLRHDGVAGAAAAPAFAWSPASDRLAAVVHVPGLGQRALVYPRVSTTGLLAAGRPERLPGPALGVAWAPNGVAVRRPDGSWDLVGLSNRSVTALRTDEAAEPDAVAWSSYGQEWAQMAWAGGRFNYRIGRWPDGDGATTGSFQQALTPADRWVVSSRSRFISVAGPFADAIGREGENLGVPEDTALPRVIQSVGRLAARGLPVTQLAFTGDLTTGEQSVDAVGVAGTLFVDPVYVPTVPDDGQRSWVQEAGWIGLALLVAAVVGWLLARRRRLTLT